MKPTTSIGKLYLIPTTMECDPMDVLPKRLNRLLT
jgi:hypothetical protein